MKPKNSNLLPKLKEHINHVKKIEISSERKAVLEPLITYIQSKVDQEEKVFLNFICTHNSRRSQFSQIWAQTAADYYGIPVQCYSGGVEETAFNERAVSSLERSGFKVDNPGGENPHYLVYSSEINPSIEAFSKIFDDPINKADHFAAIMTCSHADENCPFIPGAEQRIPVRYEDPKAFDDTPEEAKKYDERSLQIASEMFYVISKIRL